MQVLYFKLLIQCNWCHTTQQTCHIALDDSWVHALQVLLTKYLSFRIYLWLYLCLFMYDSFMPRSLSNTWKLLGQWKVCSHLQDGGSGESLCHRWFAFFCPLGDEWPKRCQESQHITSAAVNLLMLVSLVFQIYRPRYWVLRHRGSHQSDVHQKV